MMPKKKIPQAQRMVLKIQGLKVIKNYKSHKKTSKKALAF